MILHANHKYVCISVNLLDSLDLRDIISNLYLDEPPKYVEPNDRELYK